MGRWRQGDTCRQTRRRSLPTRPPVVGATALVVSATDRSPDLLRKCIPVAGTFRHTSRVRRVSAGEISSDIALQGGSGSYRVELDRRPDRQTHGLVYVVHPLQN